jgi:hypothetical protein
VPGIGLDTAQYGWVWPNEWPNGQLHHAIERRCVGPGTIEPVTGAAAGRASRCRRPEDALDGSGGRRVVAGARCVTAPAHGRTFDLVARLDVATYERRPEYQRGLRNYESGLRNGSVPARFRPRRASCPWRSRSSGRRRRRSPPSCPQDPEAVAERAFEGAGDRRVRARVVDARRRVAVRAGRAGEAVDVTASRICEELRDRYGQFKRRDLYDTPDRCASVAPASGAERGPSVM